MPSSIKAMRGTGSSLHLTINCHAINLTAFHHTALQAMNLIQFVIPTYVDPSASHIADSVP